MDPTVASASGSREVKERQSEEGTYIVRYVR